MWNRERQKYLFYLVFDQQKIRYYEISDATYPLSNAELRLGERAKNKSHKVINEKVKYTFKVN